MDWHLNPYLIDVQDDVRTAFGWSYQDDFLSAKNMADAMNSSSPYGRIDWNEASRWASLVQLVKRLHDAKRILCVGANVDAHILLDSIGPHDVLLAADGAVGACLDSPSLVGVFSDGDGGVFLERAAQLGVPIILHAHGDNQETWNTLLNTWSTFERAPSLILTHQTREKISGLYNFGGFTDGDRLICFLMALNIPIQNLVLVGYSTEKIGQWSGVTNPPLKLQKLKWMKVILNSLGLLIDETGGKEIHTNIEL